MFCSLPAQICVLPLDRFAIASHLSLPSNARCAEGCRSQNLSELKIYIKYLFLISFYLWHKYIYWEITIRICVGHHRLALDVTATCCDCDCDCLGGWVFPLAFIFVISPFRASFTHLFLTALCFLEFRFIQLSLSSHFGNRQSRVSGDGKNVPLERSFV